MDFHYQILCHVRDAGVPASAADTSGLSDSDGHRGPGPGQPATADPCLLPTYMFRNTTQCPHVPDQHPDVCPPLPWPCLTLASLENKGFLTGKSVYAGSYGAVFAEVTSGGRFVLYLPVDIYLQRYLSD